WLAGMRLAEERVQQVDEHTERDAQETDGAVLAPQKRLGTFLDRVGDLPHFGGAVVLPQHEAAQTPGDGQRKDGEPQDESNQHSELWLLGARHRGGLVTDSQGDRYDTGHVPPGPSMGWVELVRHHALLELPAVRRVGDRRVHVHPSDAALD